MAPVSRQEFALMQAGFALVADEFAASENTSYLKEIYEYQIETPYGTLLIGIDSEPSKSGVLSIFCRWTDVDRVPEVWKSYHFCGTSVNRYSGKMNFHEYAVSAVLRNFRQALVRICND